MPWISFKHPGVCRCGVQIGVFISIIIIIAAAAAAATTTTTSSSSSTTTNGHIHSLTDDMRCHRFIVPGFEA